MGRFLAREHREPRTQVKASINKYSTRHRSQHKKRWEFSYSSLITRDKMPSPSQLSIATSSVQRLVKEEASYHRELSQQQSRLDLLLASKGEDENAEFQLKQEVSKYYHLCSA